jgi:serine/threonine protein kinase
MTALRFLHEGNDKFTSCFHRDVKSANIVLKRNLSAQLIDCGLAKFISDDSTIQSSTGAKGTPGYSCPQYSQRGYGYTEACDIFSFGVVLTELITGRLQHDGVDFIMEYIDNDEDEARMIIEDIDPIFALKPKSCPEYTYRFCKSGIRVHASQDEKASNR